MTQHHPAYRPLDRTTLIGLTRALEEMESFVFLETCRPSDQEHLSWLLTEPLCWLTCENGSDPDEFLSRAEGYRQQGMILAGWLAYEFGTLLEPSLSHCLWPTDRPESVAELGVFERATVWDHHRQCFLHGQGWPRPGREDSGEETAQITELRPSMEREEFVRKFSRIIDYIESGDTYQVNFTFGLDFSFAGSPAALYRRLRDNQSVAYAAWIRHRGRDLMSFSPELFFRLDSRRVTVRPMKGTLARGRTWTEDRRLMTELAADAKSRAENVMIVDLLRNDLGRLVEGVGGGRVETRSLFDVEVYERLLQMTSTVTARFDQTTRIDLATVLRSLFPCGSVTGAPKIRTMEIIRELETRPRGVYCGGIGIVHGDSMCFNVPIRTLVLQGQRGSMGIGAGIVHDSDARSEWQECLLKGRFLTHPRPEFHLIETLAWRPDEGYVLLDLHLKRLADSAAWFLFQHDPDGVRAQLASVARTFDQPMRVRLLLNRDGAIELSATPLPGPDSDQGIRSVLLSPHRTDPDDPFLFHKTTRRHLYDQEFKRAVKGGHYDAVFMNRQGEFTEGAISSLFVERNGQLLTPPLRCGLLPGTLRQSLLDSGRAREAVLTSDDLARADRMYVGNSVRGLVEVRMESGDLGETWGNDQDGR